MEFIAALQPKYSGVSVVVFFKSCTGASLSVLDISRNACIMIGLKEAVCLAVVFLLLLGLHSMFSGFMEGCLEASE